MRLRSVAHSVDDASRAGRSVQNNVVASKSAEKYIGLQVSESRIGSIWVLANL